MLSADLGDVVLYIQNKGQSPGLPSPHPPPQPLAVHSIPASGTPCLDAFPTWLCMAGSFWSFGPNVTSCRGPLWTTQFKKDKHPHPHAPAALCPIFSIAYHYLKVSGWLVNLMAAGPSWAPPRTKAALILFSLTPSQRLAAVVLSGSLLIGQMTSV